MFLYLCGTLLPLEQKFVRNISRSKSLLLDSSAHSLMTHSGRQTDGKTGFCHPKGEQEKGHIAVNLFVCPRLFAFNLKSKVLNLFVEKTDSTKNLKISLQK